LDTLKALHHGARLLGYRDSASHAATPEPPHDFGDTAGMASRRPSSPARIRLSDERRSTLVSAIKAYSAEEFDEPLSDFRAEALLEFFIRELGPPVYNQGVRDAAAYVQAKLADIDGEVYERDA
jgi:uncharacterized protein (DUF2164 family)